MMSTDIFAVIEDNDKPQLINLLKNGANQDNSDEYGWSPLHFAISLGDLEIVKILIDFGADVDLTDSTDTTPLHIASLNGYLPIVEQLIKAGVNLEGVSRFGQQTALLMAAENGHLDVVELLISAGANLNHVSSVGDTLSNILERKNLLEKLSTRRNKTRSAKKITNALRKVANKNITRSVSKLKLGIRPTMQISSFINHNKPKSGKRTRRRRRRKPRR